MPQFKISTATSSTIYREYLVNAPDAATAERIVINTPYQNMIGESVGDEDAEPEILGCDEL